MFTNRHDELAALARWWEQPGAALGLVWGRRRVGKTSLLEEFARDKRAVFHTGAGRPTADELRLLSEAVGQVVDLGARDLGARPFTSWDDAFDSLAAAASRRRLLLVIDEYPDLVRVSPELPGVMRAFWDRARSQTKLRIVVCGSAVRTMEAIQEERAPLYGRFDLALLVHPFRPHEAAALLKGLSPADRALVWGIVGGVPLYLSWWDPGASVRQNLLRLACTPGGRLLDEGRLVLATEGDVGGLAELVLRAIASGRTRHNEIEQAVRAEPGRTLERLVELRLVERLVPVTENPARTRRRIYRIADNFLAFWLGLLDRHRSAISRGLGKQILPVLTSQLDDHMGDRWESAFRQHLLRLAAADRLGEEIVDIGRWWQDSPPTEIDAVALAGQSREAVLLGEAKWSRRADAATLRAGLERKATVLPRLGTNPRYAIAARTEVRNPDGVLAVTAADMFDAE
ncbi:MAG TPA: ATP-binding protein [Solirubrobacterales bacterium]|nr:ATP-binding protein [Solirubrobacterales bacterium]